MSDDNKSSGVRKLLIGTAVAATAGYVAGLLTAPKSGKETRSDIKSAAIKKREAAERELNHLHGELDKVIDKAKARSDNLSTKAKAEIKDVINKAKESRDKTTEVLRAVRHGDAEDQDLKRAIQNAQNSIENLKEYIKK